MKKILWVFLIGNCFPVYAQHTGNQMAGTRELKIGDQCPDFKFDNIINYHVPAARLSDFRGKLVILDFWATWCGPCIAAMPRLDSLQEAFRDKLIILPVTYESPAKVKEAVREKALLKNISLPVVTGDTVLGKHFRRRFIPHEVWINEAGKVIGISGPEEINEKNLLEYFRTRKLNIEMKQDIIDYDMNQPLFYGSFGSSYKPNVRKLRYGFNVIQGWIKGWGTAWVFSSATGNVPNNPRLTRIFAANLSLHRIYILAFIGPTQNTNIWETPGIEFMHYNRIYWEAKDSSLFNLDVINYKGSRKNAPDSIKYFTIEMITALKDSARLKEQFLAEINKYFGDNFGITGSMEKRKVKYWALVRTTRRDLLKTRHASSQPALAIDEDKDTAYVRNVPLRGFLDYWQALFIAFNETPVIDETGYTGAVDLRFAADPKSIESMSKGLNKFGLALELKEGNIDMIVIKDR